MQRQIHLEVIDIQRQQLLKMIIAGDVIEQKKVIQSLLLINSYDKDVLNVPDKLTGWTPLTLAIVLGRVNILKTLFTHPGIDANAPIFNVTEFSANTLGININGFKISHLLSPDIVNSLKETFQTDLKTNKGQNSGITPFYISMLYNPDAVDQLLQHNANVNLHPPKLQPALIACYENIEDRKELLYKLIEHKDTDINILGMTGSETSLIFLASSENNIEIVKKLLSTNKVNMNSTFRGLTPWGIACKNILFQPGKKRAISLEAQINTVAAFIHHHRPQTREKPIVKRQAGFEWKYEFDVSMLINNLLSEQSIEILCDVYEKINMETVESARERKGMSDELAEIILSKIEQHPQFNKQKVKDFIDTINLFVTCKNECKKEITNLEQFITIVNNINSLFSQVFNILERSKKTTKWDGIDKEAVHILNEVRITLSYHYYSFFASLGKIKDFIIIKNLNRDELVRYKNTLETCYNHFHKQVDLLSKGRITMKLLDAARVTTKELYFEVANILAEISAGEFFASSSTRTNNKKQKQKKKKAKSNAPMNNVSSSDALLAEAMAKLEKLKSENSAAQETLERLKNESKDNQDTLETLTKTLDQHKGTLQTHREKYQSLAKNYQLTLMAIDKKKRDFDTVDNSIHQLKHDIEKLEEDQISQKPNQKQR